MLFLLGSLVQPPGRVPPLSALHALHPHLVQHCVHYSFQSPRCCLPSESLSSLQVNHLTETREDKCIHLISFTLHSLSKHLLNTSKTASAKIVSVLHIRVWWGWCSRFIAGEREREGEKERACLKSGVCGQDFLLWWGGVALGLGAWILLQGVSWVYVQGSFGKRAMC